MRVAFVTTFDSHDATAWSGTIYHLARALSRLPIELLLVDNLRTTQHRFRRHLKRAAYRVLRGEKYLYDRDPDLAASLATQVASRLATLQADVVFAPGSLAIAKLETTIPVCFYTDATFTSLLDLYLRSSRVCRESIRDGNDLEREAIRRARLVIYASEWAARSAVTDYGADPHKVHVVPFGANLESPPPMAEVEAAIRNRAQKRIDFLTVAVEWHRKGGDISVEVVRRLRADGIDAHLTVVGCNPPGDVRRLDFVDVVGFLDKRSAPDRARLDSLYARSHYFIMPSRAEAFGVVYCEAAAWGVPSLGTDVGGIPSAISDGKSGRVFPLDRFPDLCVEYVKQTLRRDGAYDHIARSAFNEFASVLNWDSAARAIVTLLRLAARPA